MLISVIILGGILLSAAGIAGLLTIYQIRAANDVVNSAKAIFAADAGIEAVSWCSFKPCPWGDFIDAPFDFDDSPEVTFKIKRKEITLTELQIVSEGRAAGGKVIRILEAIFETSAP